MESHYSNKLPSQRLQDGEIREEVNQGWKACQDRRMGDWTQPLQWYVHVVPLFFGRRTLSETNKQFLLAFQLKQREFEPYEVAARSEETGVSSGTPTAPSTSKVSTGVSNLQRSRLTYTCIYFSLLSGSLGFGSMINRMFLWSRQQTLWSPLL